MTQARTAVVVLGHGSRVDSANQALTEVARRVADLTAADRVETAFLQFAEPGLAAAVERCAADGAARIAVVPFFLFPGSHVREDIPKALEELRLRHPGVEIVLAGVLGDHPKLAEAAADRAREVLA